jgi:predicted alpha-1,2-mannosidase
MDSIFSTPPTSDFSYYGFKIHEILEMELIEMGQYAHGNQPIQHALYLYNYVGQPWKTQEKVRYVMENLYGSAEDGYCGDEDNGQTSAWYLFSSIGFYPVAPVTGQYVIGSPMYDRVEISLSNDKKVIINTQNNKKESVYIEKLLIDGKEYDKNWFSHESMLNGVEIDFFMQNRPNFKWGSSEESVPFSMSNKH